MCGRTGSRACTELGATVDDEPVAAAVVTAAAGLDHALRVVEPGGRVVVFAAPDEPMPGPPRCGVSKGAVDRRLAVCVACVVHGRGRAAARADAAAGHVAAARAVSRGHRPVSAWRRAEGCVHAVRAALLYGSGDLRIEELPRPEAGPGDVVVQVELALTDGTDLKTYRRGHPLLARSSPAPFGHEFCGFVDGRRVVAANSAPCLACDGCARGEQCRELVFLAGAYAEWIVVPERIAAVNLHHVPHGARAGSRGDGRASGVLSARRRACGHRGGRSRRDPRGRSDRPDARSLRRRRRRLAGRRRWAAGAAAAGRRLRRGARRRTGSGHRHRGRRLGAGLDGRCRARSARRYGGHVRRVAPRRAARPSTPTACTTTS